MKTRQEMEELGRKILNASRTELYLDMRFMGSALNSLDYRMNLSTTTVGTDAVSILFNPQYLFQLYMEQPDQLNRTYMHILMHCLFRHMFSAKQHEDAELWDMSVDIAAESVVDSMEYPCIRRISSDFRDAWYARLTQEIHVLTAEKIYRFFLEQKRDYDTEAHLAREFHMDDHSFWERMEPGQKQADKTDPDQPPVPDQQAPGADNPKQNKEKTPAKRMSSGKMHLKESEWEKNAKRVKMELEMLSSEASAEAGSLDRVLQAVYRRKNGYWDYLKQFAVVREETVIDPDSFDYGLYQYGISFYGNMPLIEENEYREVKRVEELVIVIDTSASCQDTMVQRFLNETAAILARQENFFHKVNIHILECDNRVQQDITIRDVNEMKRYASQFHIKGGYGTDFRPAFAYVEEMQRRGQLKTLRGLLYFTDGFGDYPVKPTKYDTAFVFYKDSDINDEKVPAWALKLYLEDET